MIANLATRQRWAWFSTLTVAAGSVLLVGVSGLYNLVLAVLANQSALPSAIVLVAATLAAPALSTSVRRALAKVLPIDPVSAPTLLALVAVILLVGVQASYQAGHDALAVVTRSTELQPIDVLGQEIPLLILAFLGVGLFTRRDLPASLARLGVVWPAPWQILLALAVAGLFIAVSQGAETLQRVLDPSLAHRLDQATSHYYAGISGPYAIVVIALAPGIAEELFFRGALQPRLGILVAALAFAAVHTQYALTVDTLLVLILGIGLGLLRRWLNTSTAITSHAVYNGLAGLGIPGPLFPWAIAGEILLAVSAVVLWWVGRRRSPVTSPSPLQHP